MPSQKKYDAVATIGEYTNAQGEKKKRYANVGTVFENEEGRLSLKLDTIPVGPGWSGYIQFFEPRDNNDRGSRQQGQAKQEPRNMSIPSNRQSSSDNDYRDDDDIPF